MADIIDATKKKVDAGSWVGHGSAVGNQYRAKTQYSKPGRSGRCILACRGVEWVIAHSPMRYHHQQAFSWVVASLTARQASRPRPAMPMILPGASPGLNPRQMTTRFCWERKEGTRVDNKALVFAPNIDEAWHVVEQVGRRKRPCLLGTKEAGLHWYEESWQRSRATQILLHTCLVY